MRIYKYIPPRHTTFNSIPTKTEIEVIKLRLLGLTFKEIGVKRNIATKTAETHMSHIRKKLNLNDSTFALVRWATENKSLLKDINASSNSQIGKNKKL